MSKKSLNELLFNPRSWGAAKHLLNTSALSGSSYGSVVNLLANVSLCGGSIYVSKDNKNFNTLGKYLISTSILSSATLIGFIYLAPMTLASLALFVAADSIIRGALAQQFFGMEPNLVFRSAEYKDTCETLPTKYLLINGIGSGILNAIITASSIMALASTSSFALPIAMASHLLKAAVEFQEARHHKSDDAQFFLNRAVSSVGSLALLSVMMLLNPMPTFGLSALYFLADGAIKTYCDGMAFFDKPALMGLTPQPIRAY